jgi:UDP-N-acetyl-D-mannosaminuronic acid dehydrogenase
MLTEFQTKIASKEARVAIIGLGYVGLPVACMFAEAGFQTIGVDLDAERVAKINAGENPIEGEEPGIAELIAEVSQSGRLQCTTNYDDLRDADAVIISVQTPIEEHDHLPRYAHLTKALEALGSVLKQGALVVIESTLAPGTMHNVAIPVLEKAVGGKVGERFYIGHCPERVTPGRLLLNLRTMNRAVGGFSVDVSDAMVALYSHIVEGDLDKTDILTAEIVKTAENAYRDVQIAFANEVARVCEALGGDVWAVRELVNKSPGRNMLLPGAGVGGHCIPKDPWLLIANVRDDVQPQVIPAARKINRAMPLHVMQMTESILQENGHDLSEAVVAVLGYAYMENSDDTRDTPSQAYLDLITPHVAEVRVQDPFVPDYRGDVMDTVRGADVVVILVKHKPYLEMDWQAITNVMRRPLFVDARRVLADDFAPDGGAVKLIGRGTS